VLDPTRVELSTGSRMNVVDSVTVVKGSSTAVVPEDVAEEPDSLVDSEVFSAEELAVDDAPDSFVLELSELVDVASAEEDADESLEDMVDSADDVSSPAADVVFGSTITVVVPEIMVSVVIPPAEVYWVAALSLVTPEDDVPSAEVAETVCSSAEEELVSAAEVAAVELPLVVELCSTGMSKVVLALMVNVVSTGVAVELSAPLSVRVVSAAVAEVVGLSMTVVDPSMTVVNGS
jgi:hypothetical protein